MNLPREQGCASRSRPCRCPLTERRPAVDHCPVVAARADRRSPAAMAAAGADLKADRSAAGCPRAGDPASPTSPSRSHCRADVPAISGRRRPPPPAVRCPRGPRPGCPRRPRPPPHPARYHLASSTGPPRLCCAALPAASGVTGGKAREPTLGFSDAGGPRGERIVVTTAAAGFHLAFGARQRQEGRRRSRARPAPRHGPLAEVRGANAPRRTDEPKGAAGAGRAGQPVGTAAADRSSAACRLAPWIGLLT